MGLLSSLTVSLPSITTTISAFAGTFLVALISRIFYCQYLHPLARFPGPWYTTSFSLVGAVISVLRKEPEWFIYLVERYGSDSPIRISPTMLLFPRSSSLRHIYWEPTLNTKSGLYGTGALGPPHLFTTLDGSTHKALRKALSNAPWTLGGLKITWESRIDTLILLFVRKMREHAAANRVVCVSDKLAEFAADVMSLVSFSEPFGCVEYQRDQRGVLKNWREGLGFFGLVGRWRWFRENVVTMPVVGTWFLPSVQNERGMGWLMCEANRQVETRERECEGNGNGHSVSGARKVDFLQHCLDARFASGQPLSAVQKRAHVTLLIQAGADTTGTALGSILRFLLTSPSALSRCRLELSTAAALGHLSSPIQYEETRQHLPFFSACIKEGLRLHPPATNLFARVVPPGGTVIDGLYVPGGTEVTTYAYVVQRDSELYGDDAERFRPERWLESEARALELEARQFTFGMGSRVCLGRDVALMEMGKLLPEIVMRFDVEVVEEGKYVVVGGVAYNEGFLGRFVARDGEILPEEGEFKS